VEAVATWVACGAEVADGDRATAVSPRARGHALAGTRGLGPSWAAGKRALPLIFLFQNFKISTNFII
jgi:hypothetical protein